MDVTIVIPVLNRREYLPRTMDSITSHLPWPARIVIVDNGSTDGTVEWIEQFISVNPQLDIKLIHEPEPGAANARNRGLAAVTTEWVYFFDSDDLFDGLPTEWSPENDMVAFPTRMDIDGKTTIRAYKPTAQPWIHIMNSMLNTIGMIFRTEWLRGIGGWNEYCKVWDDWELGTRALLASPRLQWITEKPCHTAIVHSDSITSSSFSDTFMLQLRTVNHVLQELPDNSTKTGRKCRKALMFRTYILSGMLRAEGNRKAAERVKAYAQANFTECRGKSVARFLMKYASRGWRGAWRIGQFFI